MTTNTTSEEESALTLAQLDAAQVLDDARRRAIAAMEVSRLMAEGRLTNRIGDKRKEQFVAAFLSSCRIDEYPEPGLEESADENRPFDYRGWLLQRALAVEFGRLFDRRNFVGPDTGCLATDLLRSDRGDQLGDVAGLPLPDVSTELVLAHLEALGVGLPKDIAVAVARRAVIILLNRRLLKKERTT